MYFVCAASDKDYMVEERAQRPVYCSILQYTAVYCNILQYTEMVLIFNLIFLVTCGCWGVAGLADEKDENRLYAHVLDHYARSRSRIVSFCVFQCFSMFFGCFVCFVEILQNIRKTPQNTRKTPRNTRKTPQNTTKHIC